MPAQETDPELIPLEAPEEQPTDELVEELLPRLDEEDERDLATTITSDFNAAILDRADWEANLAMWDEQYHGVLPKKDFPWVGCSNFHVPLTALGVETLKPRLMEAILGADPPVLAVPTESFDEDRRDRVEMFLNWQVQTEMDLAPIVEESAHLFLIPGTVVAKIGWRRDVRRVKAIRHFPPTTPVEEMFRQLFGPVPPTLTSDGPLRWKGTIETPGGAPRKVSVRMKVEPEQIHVLLDREEVVYDGARVDLVPPEDFIVPVKGGVDLQSYPWLQQRLWLTENDLRRKVQEGRFYEDAVEQLLAPNDSPAGDTGQQDTMEVRALRAEQEGVAADGTTNVRNEQYEVLEDYRRYDIDDDGFEEEIITWVCPQLDGRILGWDYLDNVYAHGRRPYRVGRYLTLPGMFYGKSFAEVIRGIQEEINTIHNQRVDYGTIQNAPIYFYRASSSHLSQAFRWKPGSGVPLDNPQQDLNFPKWGGTPVWGQNEESLLYQYFERLTGLTDLALGRQPNRVGATRTATGVASLLSEAGLRFKTAMSSFQRFWAGIFEDILALDQQYLPPGKEFRVTGRFPEILKINDRAEIAGRYDLRLSATTETLNRQVMREDATVKLNAAMNPISLQLGIIGDKGLRRLHRAFFRAYGETDPDLIVEPAKTEVVMTPEEELAMFVDGLDREPSMLENLGQHLDAHMGQAKDPMIQQQLGTAGMKRLQEHTAKTLQLAQMQMVIQQMQGGKLGGEGAPVVGEQAQNAQIGKTAPEQAAGFGGGTQQPPTAGMA